MKLFNIMIALFFFAEICFATSNLLTGEKIYERICADCHDGGFWGWISGAPSIHNKSDWEKYLKKDLLELIQSAKKGTDGGMDPKGGCEECTDEEIGMAVNYMVSQVNR